MISQQALIAQKLLASCGIDDPASVSIEDLITLHDGIVKETPLENCDGRVVMKNGRSFL